MSYEGYEQILCKNGHYHTVDAMEVAYDDTFNSSWRCKDCNAPMAWIHSVDTTNDAGTPAYLELKTAAEFCECGCGNIHVKTPGTYHIPTGVGHLIE
jgi:hypothetical protein